MLKVMVIDNDIGLVQLLQLVLESRGFDVRVATNGDEALEMLKIERPDVILLDLMAPKKEGLEVCRRVRASSHADHVPLVVLSAKSDAQTRFQAMKAGADDYLVKPIRPSDLVKRLTNVAQVS